jgi:hypothetical protein
VVRPDLEPGIQVQAVRVAAILADAGVEVELTTTETAGLAQQPIEQPASVAAPPGLGQGRKVVDVEVPPPVEAVSDAEAGNRDRIRPTVLEDADQPVALRALNVVHRFDEALFVGELGA